MGPPVKRPIFRPTQATGARGYKGDDRVGPAVHFDGAWFARQQGAGVHSRNPSPSSGCPEHGGVFVCPSFIDPALDAFGQSLLDGINARLATQDPFFSASFDDEATALIARTHALPIDENGRVRIPDALIAHAGLKDKIVFVGKAQKFQIWDADRYAPIEAEAIARVKAKMERARNGEAS